MLTQTEANTLIAMRKSFVKPSTISVVPGAKQSHELVGQDPKERFLLDIWRGTLKLTKLKCQNRGRVVIVLVRLDLNGSPHTNPDGQRVPDTHLHIYREGFEDRWAYPVDPAEFSNVSNMRQALLDFCRRCNIDLPPATQGVLE